MTKEQAKDALIELLMNQVTDLTLMSKIELGDDVIAEIKRLQSIIRKKVMTREQKNENILTEMYRRAFAASTPKGDFDELMANATINEFGQKVIPFMDYKCKHEVMEQIVEDVLKENKVPKWRRQGFKNAFMLGCSPTSFPFIDTNVQKQK